ncbi:MAG: MYXO-CTERM sorting domain-containing protein [Byssovorax sp.]
MSLRSSFFRRRGLLLGSALGAAAALLAPSRALAYDALATDCNDNPLYCKTGAVKFDHTDALPIEWMFDTGWVPQGSPLQVHLWAGVFAHTHVGLGGSLQTEWPDALTLTAPGRLKGGVFDFDYGAELGAQGKVDINVAGQHFTWTGDLPYIPNFDFQLKAQENFDAWGFDPGVTISGKTPQQKLASIGLSDIIGNIPGLDGGFELDVAMELSATYVTTQIVIATTDGQIVSGGPITKPDGQTSTPYLGGPSVELDIHPEGTVDYDGTIHMIPAFFIEVLGQSWSIPVADIPISFPITKTDWVFDAQRVHVPLPDLVLPKKEIDFGDVEVGQKSLVGFSLWNAGEAKVHAAIVSDNPDLFPPYDAEMNVDPGVTADSAVRFVPKLPGEFVGQLLVTSNDPSTPAQIIVLKGRAYGGYTIPKPNDDDHSIVEAGGCGCHAAGSSAGTLPVAMLLGLPLLGLRGRRRRAQRGRR